MNLSQVNDIKIPEGNVVKITSGDKVLWQKDYSKDYSKEYFTIEFYDTTGTKNITVKHSVSYSTDKKNWTSVESGTTISVTASKVYFKNVGNTFTTYNDDTSGGAVFILSNDFKVSGNIMSLLYGDDFIGQTVLTLSSNFRELLTTQPNLIDASNLILPATTITGGCYRDIMAYCSNLKYSFKELPAETIGNYSYREMFYTCTSLLTAPEFKMKSFGRLGSVIYAFYNTKVTSIKIATTEIPTSGAIFTEWLTGTPAGVLYKPKDATYDDSLLKLPSTWTVETY